MVVNISFYTITTMKVLLLLLRSDLLTGALWMPMVGVQRAGRELLTPPRETRPGPKTLTSQYREGHTLLDCPLSTSYKDYSGGSSVRGRIEVNV